MERHVGTLHWSYLNGVTAQIGTRILRDNGGGFLVVLKELCYGKAETLEDAEAGVRPAVGKLFAGRTSSQIPPKSMLI